MDYDKYIFLDYEHTKDINIDIIDEKVKMMIIIGEENEDKIPVDLIKKTQPFENSIEWLQIKNKGNKNALHFFIVYFFGHYISNQGNKEFIIYSKNKDYDPLIEYLQNKNINVKKIVPFRQINEKTRNSFIRNPFWYILAFWNKMAVIRKIIFAVIILAVIGGFVALASLSTPLNMVAVIGAPILDEDARNRITTRINKEGYKTSVTAYGIVMVEDADIARKMRVILIREDLIPKGTAPWRIFDFEWNVYSLRAQTQMVKDHIMALGGVDDADVSIIIPKDTLFTENQNPVSASVIIFPTPGSDITKSRKKIEGIQKIVKFAVEGLKDENIVIVDQTGLVINDFEYLKEIDEQNRIERRQKFIQKMEGEYRAKILEHFQSTFSPDRIRNLDVKFEIDWSNIASLKIARKTVFVNIDGIWRIKYNEKGKPVLLADGSIEREYIPIPPQDLHAIKSLIQDIIGYNELKGDSVTVTNIAFDRVNEFKIEDSKYFRQEIFKYIFLLIIPLMIIILIVIIIKKNIMGAKGTKSSN